ncbi:MAG: hypothetical protein ABWZ01_05145 [Methyloceanibacter sp.]
MKLQWKSTGGPCRLGDRTLTVSSIDQTSQRVVARQSQTPKEIKPGGWVTLPFVTSLQRRRSARLARNHLLRRSAVQ